MSTEDQETETDWDEFYGGPSKSQRKREAEELQKLGVQLTKLPPEHLELMPLTEELSYAISQLKTMKKREAIRRQMQLIGKLMRRADHEAIESAIEKIKETHDRATRMSHAIEKWRDDLIVEGEDKLGDFFKLFPRADRQQLRHLVRAAKTEKSQQKPPAHARKLFKLLRDTMNANTQDS